MNDTTIIMGVRHWPDVAQEAVESIRKFTLLPIVIVDDASPDADFSFLASKFENVKVFKNEQHLQHGRTLDIALRKTNTPWVITADHDLLLKSERAVSLLLEQRRPEVGAVGDCLVNNLSEMFGPYISSIWALWNAKVIKEHHLSFNGIYLGGHFDFAHGQIITYQLKYLGRGSGYTGLTVSSKEIVGVNLREFIVHRQIWKKRGQTWQKETKKSDG